MIHFVLAALLLCLTDAAAASVKISPQFVADRTLDRGQETKSAKYAAERNSLYLSKALAPFDLGVSAYAGYEYSMVPGLVYPLDLTQRTLTNGLSVQQQLRTGTKLTAGYDEQAINNVMDPLSTITHNPKQYQDSVFLTVRQPLLRNVFGYADRLNVELAAEQVRSSNAARDEAYEVALLHSMALYWNAYVAQVQLKENLAAREKYQELVENVRRKLSFSLSSPGEVPRIEAEFGQADQRVKTSSAQYLAALDLLLTAIKLDTTDEVEFDVPSDVPALPNLTPVKPEDLRPIRVAQIQLENAKRELSKTSNLANARVDLVGKARLVGTQTERGAALSEMIGGHTPDYFVGVEVEGNLDSELLRGEMHDRVVAIAQAENDFNMKRDQILNELKKLEREAAANHAVALSMRSTVDARVKVVREVESAYRQGRQALVELIRAYNDMFNARLEDVRALGNYHISLNQWAAARDELLEIK